MSKGIQKLVEYSIKINDTELTKYLKEKQNRKESVRIHRQCQKEVYNELKRKNPIPDTLSAKVAKVSTRSSVGSEFAWKSDCFFCQKSCLFDPKHFGRSDCHHVTTLPLKTKILDVCSKRKDEWAISVQRRVLDCHDLIAAEARYHESCYRNFVLGRASRDETHHQSTAGRPADENCLYFFDQVCEWLEKEGELRSLEEIYVEMVEVAGSAEKVYSKRWLKRKLKEKYQDHIFFSEINGKNDIVCFQNMVGYLVNDKWFLDRKKDIKEEAERIVLTAAKIILNDIRSSDVDNQWYPTNEVIEDCKKEKEWLPTHLRLMLESIIKYPVKQASIGQAIVGAIRPRSSMPPIMFGLGVQLDHVFGSKWLLSQLNRLGFCASSHSVNCYKQAVVQNEDVSDIISNYIPGSFTQWSADNVDHNVRSLDGHGTLHAMGIVASTTSSNNNHALPMSKIARQRIQKVGNVIKGKGIPIIQYIAPEISGLSKINFKPLLQLQQPYVLPFGTSLDLLWHLSIFFSKSSRPNWSGYMSNASAGSYPGKSTISILPIIDLDPTNLSCIFSTLRFIEEQANIINIPTPVVTFDQPLWLKATEIVSAKSMNIVLVLGGFHLMMSFLGSIGTVMNGSGLSDALQSIYAPKAVEHMMSGKAVSRALRGHFLLASALMTQLLDQCFPELSNDQERIDDPFQESDDDSLIHQESNEEPVVIKSILNECEVDQIESLCKNVLEGGAECVELVNSSEEIYKLRTIFEEYKEKLIKSSRTAKLWIQYLEYINILQLFIRAERTGNWNLHLVSIGKMINLFAATAHINYAKSSRLHLQTMLDLSATHPWVYENFAAKGFHTVRRSDRFWAGLWTDLIIEQVMMRAIKSRGGLTRGRGVSENVRVMWINSMHRCASVHSAMCSLTGLQHKTSEQHIELGVSRVRRDNDDLRKLQNWLRIHNPFDKNETALKSISTGLIVGNGMDVNCDEAEESWPIYSRKIRWSMC